jgi:hypothetical protein
MKKRVLKNDSSSFDLIELKKKNVTDASFQKLNSQLINSSVEQSKNSSSYVNQIKKMAQKTLNESSTEKQEVPLFIQKALKQKQEREKEQNNSLMSELASKLNFLKRTIKSGKESVSDEEEEVKVKVKKKRSSKRRSSVFEKQSTLEIKQKKELIDRVFWTKEKMEQIRTQLRTAKDKINEKTHKDFNELNELIDSHNSEAIM